MLHETSAVILASGAGSRLGEITANTPKPLLEFNGKPYLGHLVDWLLRNEVADVTVTAHTHGDQIEDFIAANYDANRVTTVREPTLAGTIQSTQYGLANTRYEDSLLLTADNLWDVHLPDLVGRHKQSGANATVMVTGKPGVPNSGKVQVASGSDTIVQMWPSENHEPLPQDTRPASTMGLYVVQKSVLLASVKPGDTSIEREPMDRLTPNVQAYWNEGFFFDYGTEANYAFLQQHPDLIRTYL